MKIIYKLLIILSIILLTWCSINSTNIVWKWEWINKKDWFLVFENKSIFNVLNEKWESVFNWANKWDIKYEIIKEVKPKQIYILLKGYNEEKRVPFWIYKIENNKLIIRQVKEFHKTLWWFDMWVSRYNFPKDFNWVLNTYKRVSK
jgi:hypothetical protein